jgi:hypothetical protein
MSSSNSIKKLESMLSEIKSSNVSGGARGKKSTRKAGTVIPITPNDAPTKGGRMSKKWDQMQANPMFDPRLGQGIQVASGKGGAMDKYTGYDGILQHSHEKTLFGGPLGSHFRTKEGQMEGGFLPFLAPLIGAVATPLVGALTKKMVGNGYLSAGSSYPYYNAPQVQVGQGCVAPPPIPMHTKPKGKGGKMKDYAGMGKCTCKNGCKHMKCKCPAHGGYLSKGGKMKDFAGMGLQAGYLSKGGKMKDYAGMGLQAGYLSKGGKMKDYAGMGMEAGGMQAGMSAGMRRCTCAKGCKKCNYGGFIGPLIGALAPAAIGALGKLFSGKGKGGAMKDYAGMGMSAGHLMAGKKKASNGRKTAAKSNPWLIHVAQFRAQHPGMAYKDVLRQAKATY